MAVSVPPSGCHGGDGPLVAKALGLDPTTILDLSQSLNPFAPDVASAAARHLSSLRRYPDQVAATRLLAETIGVDPSRVLLTNGGSEAISLVAAEVGGQVLSEPEFGLHPRGQAGPVWRSDPHNPSGRLADSGQGCLGAVDQANDSAASSAGDEVTGDTVGVWDEAFYPLATGHWTAGRPGITVGSLTKTFACPGLRLGYVIADDVERFAHRQPQWSVSSLALGVLPELLASSKLSDWSRAISSAREELVMVLKGHEFEVHAADGPWVLANAPGLRERLAQTGIVVRDCASFGWPGTVRIAVPDADGLARLDTALGCGDWVVST